MYSYKVLVDTINKYDENEQWFWVAATAKDAWPVLKNHLGELREIARWAVEHYMEEE